MRLETGETVEGRYQVEGYLGAGAMASVYRVTHARLGTSHALKVLKLSDERIAQRMLQEGRVQASLRHPNVVSVSDVVDLGGAPGLVMELVEGPPLDVLIRDVRPNLEQVDALARGIIAGVAAAHRAGHVHRDLKPGNILCATEDDAIVPKVADFGLAKVVQAERGGHHTRSGVVMGTPAYMAPEQVRDAKGVDARADIWALGAILYELCTGTRAFHHDDTYELLSLVTAGRYIDPAERAPELPERFTHAIRGALTVAPDERLQDCAALLAVWTGSSAQPEAPAGPWNPGAVARARALSAGSEAELIPPPVATSAETWADGGSLAPSRPGGSGRMAARVGAVLATMVGSVVLVVAVLGVIGVVAVRRTAGVEVPEPEPLIPELDARETPEQRAAAGVVVLRERVTQVALVSPRGPLSDRIEEIDRAHGEIRAIVEAADTFTAAHPGTEEAVEAQLMAGLALQSGLALFRTLRPPPGATADERRRAVRALEGRARLAVPRVIEQARSRLERCIALSEEWGVGERHARKAERGLEVLDARGDGPG